MLVVGNYTFSISRCYNCEIIGLLMTEDTFQIFFVEYMHFLKTNLNLCIKKPSLLQLEGMQQYCILYSIYLAFVYRLYLRLYLDPETRHLQYRYIGSHRDRLGFHAEIHISLGTIWEL